MKRSAFFRYLSFFFAAFALTAACTFITHASTVQTAEEPSTSSSQNGDHFSPVNSPERLLANRINGERKRAALPALKADWDLFRFARSSAEDLAAGRSEKVDVAKLTRLFGRGGGQVVALVFRASLNAHFSPAAERLADHEERLIKKKTLKRIGTGYATGKKGQVWVVLLSE
ncbi:MULTISPECIES: hypothetical protein [unclassified Sporolactobacillus]|uniref:hypothetical protein n=1 Tax=unclassified Sporolactobacillus TaxID=2628533 RepID=UPI0023677977|nr:hypothetical protein [Sporolactobacillus sp. CQH2019]MDD9147180.1 hypothetical protein [Sporolactobacillus sp. CQH2019]